MKNKDLFSLADAYDPTSSLRVVHSSLSDFAPDLAREEEFPAFPAKLGVVTRFRETRNGYVATIETEWPALISTTHGILVLCTAAEEQTKQKTFELIERCKALAYELTCQANRLQTELAGASKLLHTNGINTSDFATSLEDNGKPRAWEIDACDRQERSTPREPRAPRTRIMPSSSRETIKPRMSASALSAILADDDADDSTD